MATKRDTKEQMSTEQEIIQFFRDRTETLRTSKLRASEALAKEQGEEEVIKRSRTQLPLGGPLDEAIADFEQHIADDYVFLDPYGDIVTKSMVIQRLRSGRAIFENFTYSDFNIRLYGDVAVVNNQIAFSGIRDGRDISGTYTETHTLQKTKIGWVFLNSHMNRVMRKKANVVTPV
ncbi:MAG TPA: nuclear transport factor 2 family protein [Rhodothermales bacterium]|nr:nuclear transport factor 2 family protein [Rhodothermales bacterium]